MSIWLHACGLFISRKTSPRYSLNRRMFGLQRRSGNFRKDRKILSLPRTEGQYLSCSDRIVVIVLTTLPLLPHILESITNFKKVFRYSVAELHIHNSWFKFTVKHSFDWNCSSMVFWRTFSCPEQRNMRVLLSLVNLIDVVWRGSVSLGTTSECQWKNWIRPRKYAITADFE